MMRALPIIALLLLFIVASAVAKEEPALPLKDSTAISPIQALISSQDGSSTSDVITQAPPPFGAMEKKLPFSPKEGKKHPFGWWGRFMDKELELIGKMDLYGVTSQLPQGYAYIKWDWGTIEAGNRYDSRRRKGPVMKPIQFTQDTDGDGIEEKLISIDMGLKGKGGGHTFQFSYGIIDALDWYIEVPFTYMNLGFSPKTQIIDDEGNRVAPSLASVLGIKNPKTFNAYQFNNELLPLLGRPSLDTSYEGKWLLGDINTGVSWNIYRNHRFSVALTPRVFLPTGHQPSSNSNLLWGTGPEMETGMGGWGAGFTQGYDVRLFQYSYWVSVVLSAEVAMAYGFPQQRAYPTNFPVPNPMAVALDPSAFPDLSHLEGKFRYTPGFSMSALLQLNVQVTLLGLSAGIGVMHSQEPELDADRSFIQMAKSLELLGTMQQELFQLGASLNLLPLYIPVELGFSYKKNISGYNAIVFDNYFQFTLKTYFPIWRDWDVDS
jgi:hypothetical protein